ncbi:MAG: hypothetical protein ACK5Q5_11020 [Planctomycetaceae bacterium]
MIATHTDPWLEFLSLSEWDRMVVTADRMQRWPDGALAEFLQRGLLRETTPQEAMDCPDCVGELCDILYLDNPVTGLTDIALCCPNCGPVEMTLDELRRWSIEWPGFVQFLAEGFEAQGGVRELVPDRLWRLGKTRWAGRPTTLFVGRAVHRDDFAAMTAELTRSTSAVLLYPRSAPEIDLPHPAVSLELACHWDGAALEFDVDYVSSQALPKLVDSGERRPRRDSNRATVKQRLKQELTAHLDALASHIRAELAAGRDPTLLPCPTRAELAIRCDSSPATVTRCFDEDRLLQQMWDSAHDLLEAIGRYQD